VGPEFRSQRRAPNIEPLPENSGRTPILAHARPANDEVRVATDGNRGSALTLSGIGVYSELDTREAAICIEPLRENIAVRIALRRAPQAMTKPPSGLVATDGEL
jgi:hypothetical protein